MKRGDRGMEQLQCKNDWETRWEPPSGKWGFGQMVIMVYVYKILRAVRCVGGKWRLLVPYFCIRRVISWKRQGVLSKQGKKFFFAITVCRLFLGFLATGRCTYCMGIMSCWTKLKKGGKKKMHAKVLALGWVVNHLKIVKSCAVRVLGAEEHISA